MKRLAILVSILLTVTSCQFFETEKFSTQEFYEEELKTIDWNDIDQYPVFTDCDGLLEKSVQERCFIEVLTTSIMRSNWESHSSINRSLRDTVWINFEISEKATITVKEVTLDSVLERSFPRLRKALIEQVDSVKLIAPAYKRGIPVRTAFSLPIVITTEDL